VELVIVLVVLGLMNPGDRLIIVQVDPSNPGGSRRASWGKWLGLPKVYEDRVIKAWQHLFPLFNQSVLCRQPLVVQMKRHYLIMSTTSHR
jgi:hypothetical protein